MIDPNNEDKNENINHPNKTENIGTDNTSFVRTKTDIKFLSSYNFDKAQIPSLKLIKCQEEIRNLNIKLF